MKNLTLQTKSVKLKEIKRDWHLIDASKRILGRLAPEITQFLQGKNKTNYAPYLDVGDFVVIINAKKIAISGRKSQQKIYTNYSGYPGGLKTINFSNLLEKNPAQIIKQAVSGMLPKNKLRNERLKRLFIYPDDKHPHQDKLYKVKVDQV